MRRILLDIIKLVISGGLIWLAFSQIDAAAAWSLLATIDPGVVALAVLLLLLQHVLGGWRFRRLLARMQHPVSLAHAVDNIFVGFFFSQIFISFIGGDAIRVWRLARDRIPTSRAFQAVLFDRVLGFVSLILLILLTLPWLFVRMSDPALRFGVLATVAMGLAATALFLMLHRLPAAWQGWSPFRLAGEISELALALSRPWLGLCYLLGLSLLIQLANVLAIYLLARGLGVSASLVDVLVLVPPVMLLAILPISFAGWGVRESSMAVALGLVGVMPEQSIAISICFGLCMIASGLPGCLSWLASRRQQTGPAGY